MKSVNPYLNFDGNTEEAFRFYQEVFGGELGIVRFKDIGESGANADRVAHVDLQLGNGYMLMGSDTSPEYSPPLRAGNNFYVMLEPESAQEAERLFQALSKGGEVEMALEKTSWAEKFGSFRDRFGVGWMINYTGNVQFTPPG